MTIINTCISRIDMQTHIITIITKLFESIRKGDPGKRDLNEILDYLEELCRISQTTETT